MSDYIPRASKSFTREFSTWDLLPDDILTNILLRLPIKSVLTCGCVSKSWKSVVKSPNFISTHLNHTIHSYNHNQTHLLLFREFDKPVVCPEYGKDMSEVYSLHWDNEAFDEYKRFDFPFHPLDDSGIFRVVGTCNGLVCLADDFQNSCNLYVWNPFIRKFVALPTLPTHGRHNACNGFGFDSKTNDYKVVRIVSYLDEGSRGEHEVNVYSLATGKWKLVSVEPRVCVMRGHDQQAFVNGAIHWAALGWMNGGFRYFVLAFDLGDEDFREIMLPTGFLVDYRSINLAVSVCGESLAVFRTVERDDPCIHVWVMKEYGVLVSWTKVLTFGSGGPELQLLNTIEILLEEEESFLLEEGEELNAVGFRNSGEVVIETEGGKLFSIDYESKKIKVLKNLRIPGFTFVDPYVESLVLLDQSEDAISY